MCMQILSISGEVNFGVTKLYDWREFEYCLVKLEFITNTKIHTLDINNSETKL